MNLEAVALASDSAVTTSVGHNKKIFGSQNKLFALSDVAPVGILIYGGATFMTIPWETLVKEYRRRRGRTVFPRLDDYVADFCQFVAEDVSGYVSEEQQSDYAEELVSIVYREIADVIQYGVSEEMDQVVVGDGESAVTQVDALVEKVVDEVTRVYAQQSRSAEFVEGAPDDFLGRIRDTIRRSRRSLRDEIFSQFKPGLKPAVTRRLNAIAERAVGAMVDDVLVQPTGMATGIVVAGFGQDDLFPSLSEVHIEGFVAGVLKKQKGHRLDTGPDHRACIVPFAQSDMIYRFMQGIAPEYDDYLRNSVLSHLGSYARVLLDDLDRYSETEREAILGELEDLHPYIADKFVEQVEHIGRAHFAREIVDVVAMLPKEQLGEMADALVNLTSLKRRVSLDDETVGGPTDVALITKGDGLVWIKRKHYFPANLNPGFFARKYQMRGTDHATEDS